MTQAAVLAQMGNQNQTFRNRIINGAMMIDQRNAGASWSATDGGFSLDRWKSTSWDGSAAVTGKYTVQQTPSTTETGYATRVGAGFTNYLAVTSSAATSFASGAEYVLQQPVEGLNCSDLAWGTSSAASITLSFWVRSSLTGSFGGSVLNSSVNRSYAFSYTISSANTWEYKTITIPGDTSGTWLTSNSIGLRLNFALGLGSSLKGAANTWSGSRYEAPTGSVDVLGTNGATWYITGVQLEKGTVATPFEQRLYGTELALCQRYYYRKTAWNNADYIGNMQAYSSGAVFGVLFYLPVDLRAANGTVGLSSASHITSYTAAGSSSTAFSSTNNWLADVRCVYVNGSLSGSSGLTAGNCSVIYFNTTSGWIDVSAEL